MSGTTPSEEGRSGVSSQCTRGFLRSLSITALSPILLGIASLITVPILIGSLGVSSWTSIALGQVVGDIMRVIVIWGWSAVAISRVASLPQNERAASAARSVVPRLLLFLLVLAPSVILPMILRLPAPTAAAWVAVGTAATGLTFSWYFLADGRPELVLILDTIPRLLGILIGSVLALVWADELTYVIPFFVGCIGSVVLPLGYLWRENRADFASSISPASWRVWVTEVRDGGWSFLIALVMVFRFNGPTLILTGRLGSSDGIIALADKFLKWGNTAMTPLQQSILAWIGRHMSRVVARVAGIAGMGILLTVIVATASWVFLPGLASALTHGEVTLSPMLSMLIVTLVCGVTLSSLLANAGFVATGRARVASLLAFALTTCVLLLLGRFEFATIEQGWAVAVAGEWIYVTILTLVFFISVPRGQKGRVRVPVGRVIEKD